ncbi:hypothetical protein K450DRAFT_217685 [Umbelopsis ramanniana AG]|uniref:F-box domain-containing protein n=1 Tax=Umbelopsis ramanniana AG TaxID=1314678 RepID=A0AAD5EJ02_UMBRA|nr:uncharacterized protein K450DRAFT_217685 [Umbelopsis ramanniana AG]KAI8584721.1 hypothetical protein K450DRAFT_217685 [Umbelopsis ramanniana AG]
MEFSLGLPNEILPVVFRDLDPQDLVSCSRTCWSWNAIANSLLYETVSFVSHAKFQQFVETITDSQNHYEMCVGNSINTYRPLGQLVKSVEITAGYTRRDDRYDYSTMLSRLASKTPNVHKAKMYLPILSSNTYDGLSFNWSNLASQWSKLTSLSLKGSLEYGMETYDMKNINDVFSRLHHLSVVRCDDFLTHMLPSLPTMPYLQSFMATIYRTSDYQALKKILQTYQTTLHTLVIEFFCFYPQISFNLDDLNIGHKQLKAFGLMKHDDTQINITKFGDNLEHLEWWIFSLKPDEILNQSIHQAMIKTSTLKTLSFAGKMALDHIPLVLEANKHSLHTFYVDHARGNDLIALLQDSKVRLYNVVTLCFECPLLENADVRSLAEIFPNVKYLALRRNRLSHEMIKGTRNISTRNISTRNVSTMNISTRSIPSGSKLTIVELNRGPVWIATESLSHFQHLKALDKITFPELVDQSLFTFQQCNIFRPKHKVQPVVIPL